MRLQDLPGAVFFVQCETNRSKKLNCGCCYWIVRLMFPVPVGVVVKGMMVVPVTVRFRVPLSEGWVATFPR